MPEKICPLTGIVSHPIPCDEEQCAWWDEDSQACAVLVAAKALKKVTKNGK